MCDEERTFLPVSNIWQCAGGRKKKKLHRTHILPSLPIVSRRHPGSPMGCGVHFIFYRNSINQANMPRSDAPYSIESRSSQSLFAHARRSLLGWTNLCKRAHICPLEYQSPGESMPNCFTTVEHFRTSCQIVDNWPKMCHIHGDRVLQ